MILYNNMVIKFYLIFVYIDENVCLILKCSGYSIGFYFIWIR